ncbi:MAG: hypothetical protein LBV47_02505 [Bacteroidales bacterium]|jgi:hypothetical protein|nr:hypothetical protein [Bacteroidales bacterium]
MFKTKKIIVFFIALFTFVVTGNAQVFIEGSLGLTHNKVELSGGAVSDDSHSTTVSVSPKIGYWLNDNIAIGINPVIGADTYINMAPYDVFETDFDSLKNRSWMLFIFGRYKLWGTEKLSLLIDTPVGFGINTHKTETDAITTSDNSGFQFSVFVNPLISYKLNEKFSVVTRLNFLSLGFSYFSSDDNNTNSKSTSSQFSFDSKSSLFNSLGNISIGFTYNFKNSYN